MSAAPLIAIRPVEPADAGQIAAIYAHHVLHGTATFDTDPPGVEQWHEKIGQCLGRQWPFLVALDEAGTILGYAYATQFRDRPAYAHACEDSIYVRSDRTGQGVGRALLAALVAAAAARGFTQMLAVIGGGEPGSVALHGRLGFRHAGRMEKVGRKFGQWLDTVYMQRALGDEAPADRPEPNRKDEP
ncbi:GNAT family N-acetyltransferase [Sphingobium lignivorans]|uniref:Phosphinothricin acetyltransferase n=1 Tax=Sphingobium lignivorans TaxID=2735886 RepID=A0ABR6NEI7_9SPHN|nr:GNAT family N-acetyltransferase [Sphingobium lignivorans]MBB5985694.1 phosphinothricin acetyltransferase [Sphingobium lignivorans]